ncbi:hypothetical protein J8L85_12625 [Maribacter sp. MMG018]|uniref:hypothetical protein n=1 Tax=Maribacter sp. MMG018 TaxID=2822688 RepID=UPI001B378821|nr:hypothetical protein [Maribacter sp. MMG018]MBQ4915289.1 hypothetical protein [Maribacter sp. MMG018]
MKKLFFLMMVLLVSQVSRAQNDYNPILAKYVITKAINNKKDCTEEVVKSGGYTAFYVEKNNDAIYMENVFANDNTKSYGPIDNIKIIRRSDLSQYKYDGIVFSFDWHYKDSYEDDQGVAKVNAILVKDKPKGNCFIMKILSDDSGLIEYSGELIGEVNDRILDYFIVGKYTR